MFPFFGDGIQTGGKRSREGGGTRNEIRFSVKTNWDIKSVEI